MVLRALAAKYEGLVNGLNFPMLRSFCKQRGLLVVGIAPPTNKVRHALFVGVSELFNFRYAWNVVLKWKFRHGVHLSNVVRKKRGPLCL